MARAAPIQARWRTVYLVVGRRDILCLDRQVDMAATRSDACRLFVVDARRFQSSVSLVRIVGIVATSGTIGACDPIQLKSGADVAVAMRSRVGGNSIQFYFCFENPTN
jgi:hypothetical protein